MKHFFIIIFLSGFLLFETNAQTSNQYSKTKKILKERYGNFAGMKVGKVIRKLNLDTSQFCTSEEPPMIISSLLVAIGDTWEIHFYVERTGLFGKPRLPSRQKYKYIERKKVRRISIYDTRTKLTYDLEN